MPAIEFNKRDTKNVVREYNNGTSLTELAALWNVGVSTIRRVLVEGGATTDGRSRPTQD